MGGSSAALPGRLECADHAQHRGKNHCQNQWCKSCSQCCWCPVLPSLLLSPCALGHHPRGKGYLLVPSAPHPLVPSAPHPLISSPPRPLPDFSPPSPPWGKCRPVAGEANAITAKAPCFERPFQRRLCGTRGPTGRRGAHFSNPQLGAGAGPPCGAETKRNPRVVAPRGPSQRPPKSAAAKGGLSGAPLCDPGCFVRPQRGSLLFGSPISDGSKSVVLSGGGS
jgi:hypothetical protein